ncbi:MULTISPECIES: DUF2732 family protein [Dickeya]|uniref:DUF2732 domain-containing protein n=1 Tax=Dickeya dianthicola TaxID=204039 RepID=A0AAX1C5D1_9GAMM|nr:MULTISPECIES: DUF2732 family protein [Dickeya]ATO31561.1 hypothetical protein DDI_0393 [Dickeya dianthicola RNS04.9]MBT1430942.1 DUF2732 family protein [Dickeya dianthicola]MCA7005031.1 DUF2732 domain-containing protein [Dickeya dianthicola]MCI4005080.1 DUF2732 domain-containing protein [Dickeya dianthicola]MCI4033128.1 DUF2732 domain-containing protein [Dickeya dianthicola]
MKNAEVKTMTVAADGALIELLNKARLEERKDQHLSFSLRLAALAIRAQQRDLSAAELVELMRQESERFEHSAQGLS